MCATDETPGPRFAMLPNESPEQAAARLGLACREVLTAAGPVLQIGELSREQIESAHREIARTLRRRRPELFQEAA